MNSTRKAGIVWREGVPIAEDFDDPYYSLAGGLEESRFVFLDGAEVIARAQNSDTFVVGETGFGTGLNFLATWLEWRKHSDIGRLIFISTEAHPMSTADMEKAHSAFPEVRELAADLRDAMPPPSKGFHSRTFDNGRVSLLLLIGDASEMLSQLVAKVDAWYLDGFAPAKNPEMWTENLFQQLERLSKPGATLATFTAAGFVRRGLEAASFNMKKTKGFARKRERLVGEFSQATDVMCSPEALWAARPAQFCGKRVGIVGGGIAGLSLAVELKNRGCAPTIISQPEPEGCSDIPIAVLAPRFALEASVERDFFASAYAFATHKARQLEVLTPNQGVLYPQTSSQDKDRQTRILTDYEWGSNWLYMDDQGLCLPQGGTVNSQKWQHDLAKEVQVVDATVSRIERASNSWLLLDQNEAEIGAFDQIVVAAGSHSTSLLKRSNLDVSMEPKLFPEIRLVGGQIEQIQAQTLAELDPRTLSYGNYVSAAVNNEGEETRSVGSTFDKLSNLEAFGGDSAKAKQAILESLKDQFGISVSNQQVQNSWTGVRAATPDHLPYVGPIPDWDDLAKSCAPMRNDANNSPTHASQVKKGLYLLTGLGSKGFQYGPILANYLAALIADDPLPLPAKLIGKLHPGRGLVKHIVRQEK